MVFGRKAHARACLYKKRTVIQVYLRFNTQNMNSLYLIIRLIKTFEKPETHNYFSPGFFHLGGIDDVYENNIFWQKYFKYAFGSKIKETGI